MSEKLPDIEEAKRLLSELDEAKVRVDHLGIVNVYGITPENRIALDKEVHKAWERYRAAFLAYRDIVAKLCAMDAGSSE